jgi:hydrogenase expression/formation protein HypC
MCLAVPMKLVHLSGQGTGKVDTGGVAADVSLAMVPHAQLGDYLIVHAGFAIEVLDHQEAEIRLDLFRELAAATAGEPEP